MSLYKDAYEQTGKRFVPAAASNRHIHLFPRRISKRSSARAIRPKTKPRCSRSPVSLPRRRDGFDCGAKGQNRQRSRARPRAGQAHRRSSFSRIRFEFGIVPAIRISGDIEGTPGATVIGPKRIRLELTEGGHRRACGIVHLVCRAGRVSESEQRGFGQHSKRRRSCAGLRKGSGAVRRRDIRWSCIWIWRKPTRAALRTGNCWRSLRWNGTLEPKNAQIGQIAAMERRA